MNYETARAFADTWGLLLLVILFLGVLVFVFRRGSTEQYRKAARIPMDAPDTPLDEPSHLAKDNEPAVRADQPVEKR